MLFSIIVVCMTIIYYVGFFYVIFNYQKRESPYKRNNLYRSKYFYYFKKQTDNFKQCFNALKSVFYASVAVVSLTPSIVTYFKDNIIVFLFFVTFIILFTVLFNHTASESKGDLKCLPTIIVILGCILNIVVSIWLFHQIEEANNSPAAVDNCSITFYLK